MKKILLTTMAAVLLIGPICLADDSQQNYYKSLNPIDYVEWPEIGQTKIIKTNNPLIECDADGFILRQNNNNEWECVEDPFSIDPLDYLEWPGIDEPEIIETDNEIMSYGY